MENLYLCISHTEEIGTLWWALIAKHLELVLNRYPGISIDEIGEEHFRVLENGDGEIFVQISDSEIRMKVPKEQWSWN